MFPTYSRSCLPLTKEFISSKHMVKKLPRGVKARYRITGVKYQARIQVNGIYTHLGTFDTPEKAGDAYKSALATYKYSQSFQKGI